MSMPRKLNSCNTAAYGNLETTSKLPLESVDSFTHLGNNIESTEKDVNIKIGKAWSSLKKLTITWTCNYPDNIKEIFFPAVIESVLLYGSSTCTLIKNYENKQDGTYTCIILAVLNISWMNHSTKVQFYRYPLPITQVIRDRRLTLLENQT